jgi:hypothetical protein
MAKRHLKSQETCAFKMRVYFKGRNMRTMCSRDWAGEKYVPHEGLLALETYLIVNADKIRTGVIYDRREILKEMGKPEKSRKRIAPKLIRLVSKGKWKVWKDVELS